MDAVNVSVAIAKKPGSLQALAIMTLISGILNCLAGLSCLGLIVVTLGITLLPGLYLIVLGILEIIYAAKLLPDPIRAPKPSKSIAIMEIIAVLTGQLLAVVVGILALVFYSQKEVVDHFAQANTQA